MGPLRRGLILTLLPGPALADACATVRPGWDGTQVSTWTEAVALFTSPAAVILLVISALALRLRSQWVSLGAFVGWGILVSTYTFLDPTGGTRPAAMAEGCVGTPTAFIVVVFALCIAMVLYAKPPERKE